MSGMKKKIFGLLIALGLAVPAFASVAVAPTRVEINANKLKNNYVTTAIEGTATKAECSEGRHTFT